MGLHIYRIQVFGTSEIIKGRGKRARAVRQGFGFDLWNPDEETARAEGRPGFGSFVWYGMHAARRAALSALMQPGIDQVAIKTNQDQDVFRFYKSNWARYVGQFYLPFAEAA